MKQVYIIYILIAIFFLNKISAQTNYPGLRVPYESCTNCLQTNYQYSGVIEFFNTRNIISDFGPRYLSTNTPYDFHGGIDYTITEPIGSAPDDIGFHIVAIETGTIIKLENYGTGTLKYMVIDGPGNNDYGYLHLFDDTPLPTQIGDMKYVEIEDNDDDEFTYGILDLTNTVLFSDCMGETCDSTFFYVNGQDTIYATNQITQANTRIGILGTSGGIGSHLHLSKYNSLNVNDFVNNDNNAVDPLEIIRHQGPEYDIKILHDSVVTNIDNYPEGVEINYPGTNYTDILIRPIMPDVHNGQPNNGILSGSNRIYNNNTLNIHKVEMLINSGVLQKTLIEGPNYESKIWLGTRFADNIKYPQHITVRSSASQGSWNQTGIKPLAYKTNSPRRWDDFYYVDFITRIHELDPMDGDTTPTMIANCPQNARYNDGQYEIKARVTDVRGGYVEGPKDANDDLAPIRFNLDNFKPFIESVNVHIGTTEVYDMQWVCESSCDGIRPEGGIISSEIDPFDFLFPMLVTVKCSEPMYSLDMGLSVYGEAIEESSISYETSADRQTWTFSVQLPLSVIEDPTPIITGNDFSFSFTGLDYPVNVGDNANANQLLNLENYYHPDSPQANTNCLQIPYRMDNQNTWSSTLPDGIELAHHFGLNCLSDDNIAGDGSEKNQIKLFNGFCCSEEFLAELSNSTSIELSPPCLCEGDILSPFTVYVNTLLGPFTYKWSGPNDYESYQQNPDDITIAGDYSVSVTNEDGCRVVQQINIPVCIPIQEPGISADTICSEGDLSTVYVNLSNIEGLYFSWSDGSTEQNLEDVSAGLYSVTINSETGCELILETEVIVGYDPLVVITLTSLTDCICNIDEPIQAFKLSISDQDTPYAYQWSGPNGFTSTQQSPLINESGDYAVTISNTFGCEQLESIHIPICTSLQASVAISPSCPGQASGEARVYPTGTFPPFTFRWSSGATSFNATGLEEGTYSVTITDDKGCGIVETLEVGENQLISILNPSTIKDCSSEGQGSITPFVTSGAAPFSYLWSNGQTTATATNLTSGNYTLTITDNLGCSQSFDFMFSIKPRPIVISTITDTYCKNNTGSILLDIQPTGNYSIQWSDGLMNNKLFRDNLPAGNYFAIIGNDEGCFTTEYFTINTIEPPIESWEGVEIGLITEAATQTYCDGSIEVLLGGADGPYNVYLQTSTGETIDTYQNVRDVVLFKDLCTTEENAPYQIIITDANGCSINKNAAIELCSLTIILEDLTSPNSAESADGNIKVSIAEDYSEIEYSWSNGATGATISGLSPGTYTVVAREENGCEGTLTFVLEECYTYSEVLDEEGEVIYEAEEPNYDNFEVVISGGLLLPGATSLRLGANIRMEGDTEFYPLQITDSNFQLEWKLGNQIIARNETFVDIGISDINTFSMIRLIVTNGCKSEEAKKRLLSCSEEDEYEEYQLQDFFITGVEHPCITAGVELGSINIQVPNVLGQTVTIAVGSIIETYPNYEEDLLTHIVSELEVGEYEISISFDNGCSFSFPYSLTSISDNVIFTGGNVDDEKCFYNRYCGDIPLGQQERSANLLYGYGVSIPRCKVPVFCSGGGEIGLKKIRRWKRMTGAEFEHLLITLRDMESSPYANIQISFALNLLRSFDHYKCGRIRACPANLDFTFYNAFPLLTGGEEEPINTECSMLYCGFPPMIICKRSTTIDLFNDIGLSGEVPPVEIENSCDNFQTSYVYELQQAVLNTPSIVPNNFWGSPLDVFLSSRIGDKRSYCAKVTFCTEDFTHVYSDIFSIDCNASGAPFGGVLQDLCEPYMIPITFEGEIIDFAEVVQCKTNSFLCNKCVLVRGIGNSNPFDFLSSPDDQYLQTLDEGRLNESLKYLGHYKFEGNILAKGIVSADGKNDFYDFSHGGQRIHKIFDIPQVVQFVDDWDTDESIYVIQIDDSNFIHQLSYSSPAVNWNKEIHANNQELNIHNLFFNNNKITLIASANSDLIIDGQALSNTGKASYNILTIDPQSGNIIDTKVFYGLQPNKTKVLEKKGSVDLLAEIPGDGIQLNDETLYQAAANEWVKLSVSPNATELDEKTRMSSEEAFNILSYAASTDQDVFIVKKTDDSATGNTSISFFNNLLGNIEIGPNPHSNADFAQIYITQSDGIPLRQISLNKAIDSEILKPLVDYDENGNLYIVITFSGEIYLGRDQQFISNGEKDILVLKLDPTGSFLWQQQYGSEDNEEVSYILAANNGLYLGGVFSGNTQSRQLGDYQIVNMTGDTTDKVFITFLQGDTPQNLIQNGSGSTINNIFTEEKYIVRKLKAYPNPFKNTFNLELNALNDDNITIEVIDLLGRLVFQQEEKVTKGFNQFEVSMKNILSSQVLNIAVRFKSGSQPIMQTRLIRK